MEFHGVKVALLYNEKLVMQLRDNKPGLFNANMWDFPGGGRDGDETPFACAKREVAEEFGIELREDTIVFKKEFPSQKDSNARSWFMVANISKEDVAGIQFGAEGQKWDFMTQQEFFERQDVIEALKERFESYLNKNIEGE